MTTATFSCSFADSFARRREARQMRHVAKALLWLGGMYLVIAILAIVLSGLTVLIKDGFRKFWEVNHPFDLWKFTAIAVAIVPGLLLLWLAEKLEKKLKETKGSLVAPDYLSIIQKKKR